MKKILIAFLLLSHFAHAQQQTIDASDPLNTGRTKINANFTELYTNALQKESAVTADEPTALDAYSVPPLSVLGNGHSDLRIMNYGNPLGNTEDRNLVELKLATHTGSILLFRNARWDDTNDRWEQVDADATAYGTSWWEIGGEGLNAMASPPGTSPYQLETGGMNFSIRHSGLRSVTGYTTGYVNQSMAPFAAVFESSASGLGQWLETTGAQPLIHLLAEETKGSGAALGEYLRLEQQGSSYGAISFRSSNGSLNSPSNSSSNKTVGAIYSTPYAAAYNRTAEIKFVTRGSIGSNDVGQSIVFGTSPDATANITDRLDITDDGLIKAVTTPYVYTHSSVTTVPVYSSFAGFSPANTSGEVFRFQHLSTSTGGAAFYGMSTTSTASTAIALGFIGALGATSPTAPAILFSARKNNGSNSLTDIAATEILMHIRNNATTHIEILGDGKAGFLQTTPTAVVDLGAGTTGRASLRIREGVAPSSPNDGDIWKETTNDRFMLRKGASSEEITSVVQVNTVTATAPNRTIQVTINGTTYYIHAKTTND